MSIFWTREEEGPWRKKWVLWDQSPQNLERPRQHLWEKAQNSPPGGVLSSLRKLVGCPSGGRSWEEAFHTVIWKTRGWNSVSCPFSISCSWMRIQARDWAACIWGEGQQCRCFLHLFTGTPTDEQVNLVLLFISKWLIEMLLCIYLSSLRFIWLLTGPGNISKEDVNNCLAAYTV